jgi:hypothetical protein
MSSFFLRSCYNHASADTNISKNEEAGFRKFSKTETIFSKPETIFPAIETLVSTIKAMVLLGETKVCGTKTLFSKAERIPYASETRFSITEKTAGEVPAAFM